MPCFGGVAHDEQRCSDQAEWVEYMPERDPDDGMEWVAYACVVCDSLGFRQDEIEDDDDATDAALDVLAASREERMEALGDVFASVMPDADDDDRCETGLDDYR